MIMLYRYERRKKAVLWPFNCLRVNYCWQFGLKYREILMERSCLEFDNDFSKKPFFIFAITNHDLLLEKCCQKKRARKTIKKFRVSPSVRQFAWSYSFISFAFSNCKRDYFLSTIMRDVLKISSRRKLIATPSSSSLQPLQMILIN